MCIKHFSKGPDTPPMENIGRKQIKLIWSRAVAAVLSLSLVASWGVVPRDVWGTMEPAASLGFSFKRSEKCVMRKINGIRRRHGLRELSRDPHIGYVSRLHATTMAGTRSVFHDDAFGTRVTNWERLGQNTGAGPGCRSIVRSFMQDPAHKEIILARWRHQGVGIQRSGGLLYVQHIFEAKADPGNVYNVP